MDKKPLQHWLKQMEKADALYERADAIYDDIQSEMAEFIESD